MTNSSRLPSAISTRCPPTTPASPSPVAIRPTSSSSCGPGQAAPAGLDDRERVGSLRRRVGDEVGHVVLSATGMAAILPHGERDPATSRGVYAADVTPPPTRAAAAEPAAAVDPGRRGGGGGRRGRDRPGHPGGPDVGGVLRRRQHRHAGRQHLPPGPRACTGASSSPPARSWAPPGSRPTSGSSASRTPSTSPTPATPRSASSPGHTVTELEELGEEIFDEAMAHRIWPGTRALAQLHLDQGQRVWLVTAAPIEIA